MNRLSEQQGRLGSFVGSGVSYIAAKTALTRSQWLMLVTFAVGAVVVGFAATRWSRPQASSFKAAVANPKPADPVLVNYSSPNAIPQRSDVAATGAMPMAASAQPAAIKADVSGIGAAKPDQGLEPATRSMLEGLAKDIARINQKLDDLAGKQKQTANRLASLIADGKQNSPRSADGSTADRPVPSNRSSTPSAAPKATVAAPLPVARVLTVRQTRVAQRPSEAERRHRAIVDAVVTQRRNQRIAERNRRLRRRVASRSIFGLRF